MSKSIWQRADELANSFHRVACENQYPASRLAELGEELSDLVKDLAEQLGLREETVEEPLVVGQQYVLVIKVEARVVDRSDGHGLCYELELDQRNFYSGRTVSVDHDEIVEAVPKL